MDKKTKEDVCSKQLTTILPTSHAVLPEGYSRDPFRTSFVDTANSAGESILSPTGPFVATHPSFAALLTEHASVRVLARDNNVPFAHEAGIWVSSTNEVWFTSNVIGKGDKAKVDISTINLATGKVTLVHVPHVRTGNGGCPYGNKLLFCEQGGRDRPSQLVLIDPSDPSDGQPILNNFYGRRFNSINDVIVLPPRGDKGSPYAPTRGSTIWFTDPTYGYEQGFCPTPQLPPQVYVFDPCSGVVRAVADGFAHPNGICFSPDGLTCYITDTSHIHGTGHLDPKRESTIYAFDVFWVGAEEEAAPQLRNKRLFAFASCGVPDGIKCDALGNVYSGCGDGIHIWNSQGVLLGMIVLGVADDNLGAQCANFCFAPGGRIVCLSEDRVYLVEGLAVEGDLLAPDA